MNVTPPMLLTRTTVRVLLVYFALLHAPPAGAQDTVLVRDDDGDPVPSQVFLTLGSTEDPQGLTDDQGELPLQRDCRIGEVVLARPDQYTEYHEGTERCSGGTERIKVVVTKKLYAFNLWSNQTEAKAQDAWADVALIGNEIVSRGLGGDSMDVSQVYTAFGRYIGVEDPEGVAVFDSIQGQTVLTAEMVSRIKAYQAEVGVDTTGALDYRTLSAAAGADIGRYLFHPPRERRPRPQED